MKQMEPRTVNGIDSYNEVDQKTDSPIRRKTTPTSARKIDYTHCTAENKGTY
jgi:hypothetical protein